MSITSFRLAVSEKVESALGIRVVPGKIDGPVNRELACCFPLAKTEVGDNVSLENPALALRVFQAFVKPTEVEKPTDPSRLEELAEELQRVLADIQTEAAAGWFFRVVGVEFELDRQFIEATLISWQDNPFNVSA